MELHADRPAQSLLLFRSWAVLLAVALSGCGGKGGHTRPTLADRTWLELRSPGFVLVTDLGEATARARLLELERQRIALMASYALVAPHRRAPSLEPMSVIFFASPDELDDVVWRDSIGGFVGPSPDFGARRVVVTAEVRSRGRVSAEAVRREILIHEIAHVLNQRYFGQAPVWLSEGLATFYETLRLGDDSLRLGEPSVMDRGGGLRRGGALPKASAILGYDHESFYGRGDRRNYVAAWFLVHLLNSPKYQPRFRNYLTALSHGVARDRAWQGAFDSVSMDELDDDFYAYHRAPDLRVWKSAYRPPVQPQVTAVRRLRPGEVHAMWASLQILRSEQSAREPTDLRDARRHVALAQELDPTWTGGLYWSAVCEYRARGGSREQAAKLMRDYTAREVTDPRGWYGLLQIELHRIVPASLTGLEGTPPAQLHVLRPIAERLGELARTSPELNLTAWYYALAHQPELGMPFATRALELEPGDPYTLDTMALLLYLSGRLDEALIMQEQAVNGLAESRPGADMLLRLAHYRKRSN